MGGRERAGDLADHGGERHRLAGKRAGATERGGQALAFQVFHDDVGLVVNDITVVDLDDAGVPDERRGARLVEEPGHDVGVPG